MKDRLIEMNSLQHQSQIITNTETDEDLNVKPLKENLNSTWKENLTVDT